MDAAEIESYTYQLAQVNRELVKDPDNPELISLRNELQDLLSLVEGLEGQGVEPDTSTSRHDVKPAKATSNSSRPQSKPVAGTSTPVESYTVTIKAGDDVMARYANDGKFYPAKVISVGGSTESPVYNVRFVGYDSTELVTSADIKAISESKKRALESQIEEERERKRKRNEKKVENKAVKAAEQNDKQKAWQKFAVKGVKKGVNIPGLSGQSMFKTPDNPYGRVGVVGSGKGMTTYAAKNKHTFSGS